MTSRKDSGAAKREIEWSDGPQSSAILGVLQSMIRTSVIARDVLGYYLFCYATVAVTVYIF